jgi:hypothetical protein
VKSIPFLLFIKYFCTWELAVISPKKIKMMEDDNRNLYADSDILSGLKQSIYKN